MNPIDDKDEGEFRLMVKQAGLLLSERSFEQLREAWSYVEDKINRIPLMHAYSDEPAHIFTPPRDSSNE